MRSKIFEDLSRETVSPGIFQKAQSHSYRLLESALINFIQKPVYQHMLEDVVELAKYPGRREQLLINITAKITIALWKTYGVRVLSKSRKLDVETIMGNERDFTSSDLRTSLEAWAQRFAFTHLQMPLPTYDSAAVTLGFSMLDTHKQKTSPASLNLRGSEPYLGSSVFATTETLTIPTHKIDGSTEQCEKNEKKNTDESGGKWFKKASIPFGSRWLNRFSKKS